MKVLPIKDYFTLVHDQYSPALAQTTRTIPGVQGNGHAINGSSDAIEAAIKWLVSVRGLNADAFENTISLNIAEKYCRLSLLTLDERLREYQRDAVKFLRSTPRAILADDMGLGKTASAISAAISFKTQKRALIVCPSYVRGVWSNKHDGGELWKWAAKNADGQLDWDVPVFECSGTKPKASLDPDTAFVICHYDILHAWVDAIRQWAPEVVIFDEAHYLMNPETRRTKAAAIVSQNAEYVWGLTGTPMTNRPRDLWGILSVIVPGRFGDPEKGFFKFGLRYCGAAKKQVTPDKVVWDFDGKSNLDELRARMQHFMLRRTKSQVALELPAKTRQVIRLEVKGAAGPTAFMGPQPAKTGALRMALGVAADAKLPQAIELLREHLTQGQKVVATCYRRAVAEHLANELGGAVIHGGVSQAARERKLHELRSSENPPILCTTIDTTSTGIDLSYADVGVLVELTYEPHEILQWEARFHRLTTRSPKLIQYLIARGTTDELIAEVVLGKLDALEAVVGGFDETNMRADLAEKEADVMADLYRRLGL